jgi:hypothetical protein
LQFVRATFTIHTSKYLLQDWGISVAQRQSVKRESFQRLVEKRMTNALHDIKLVGNLSNRSAYDYTDKDVRKIVKALEDAISELKQRFKNPASTGRTEFKIGD